MIEWLFTRFRLRNARRWAVREQVKVLCDCHRARPSERDLTGHRPGCVNHPPPNQRISEDDLIRWFEQEDAAQRRRAEQLNRWADQLPPEARHLVRDPNDRLWLLGDDGRVNRPVKPEELESWGTYAQPTDLHAVTGEVVHLTARYRGIPFSISRVDWAEYVRLGGPPPGPPNPPRAPHDRPYA